MRILTVIAASLFVATSAANAQVYVHGYTTKNGTYVAPHYRSAPDSSPYNNYSTKGNVNPYTGQVGTTNPYSGYVSPYSSYKPLYTPAPKLYGNDDSDDGE